MDSLCNIFDEDNIWILVILLIVCFLICNCGPCCEGRSSNGCGCGC